MLPGTSCFRLLQNFYISNERWVLHVNAVVYNYPGLIKLVCESMV